jgi:hypothetical protein
MDRFFEALKEQKFGLEYFFLIRRIGGLREIIENRVEYAPLGRILTWNEIIVVERIIGRTGLEN